VMSAVASVTSVAVDPAYGFGAGDAIGHQIDGSTNSALDTNYGAFPIKTAADAARVIAKPIVDIVLVVADSRDETGYAPALERAGYQLCIREPGWYEHRMFKGVENEVDLHVFSVGCLGARGMPRASAMTSNSPSTVEVGRNGKGVVASLTTASARRSTELLDRGMDPWPGFPRARRRKRHVPFSAVRIS